MYRELTRKDLIYDFNMDNVRVDEFVMKLPEYNRIYSKIDLVMNIDKKGYNLFIVDSYSPEKLANLIEYISKKLEEKSQPNDICLISDKKSKAPETVKLPGGFGERYKKVIENIQDDVFEYTFSFYNELFLDKRDNYMEEIENKRDALLEELINKAKDQDIEIRYSEDRFAFIPVKEDKAMTEAEYDELTEEEQSKIVEKIQGFKKKTKEILYEIKDIEEEGVEKGKKIFGEFISKGIELNKDEYFEAIDSNEIICEMIEKVLENIKCDLVEGFTNNYSEDEKKISEAIFRYKIRVLVDNKEEANPKVVFEDDPTIANLIGTIDYESVNGSYIADMDNIKAGSLLMANDGVLIIRASSLLKNANAYHYLKKTILTGKIDMNYSKGYLELLSIGGFKPTPIDINTKIILIGGDEYFDLLYTYDSEFAETFKVKTESDRIVDINDEIRKNLVSNLVTICKNEKHKPLTNNAIKEIAKFLSRKAGSSKKVYFDYMDISKLLTITNNYAIVKGKHNIDEEDIREYVYSEELIEEHILESYKNKKILINCDGEVVGKINGLSVIDLGYHRFGRVLRLTCTCHKGTGMIVDVQKESDLSGKVHTKSINILKGFLNQLIGGYSEIPVDFHVSFEQVYGVVEGDSASIAETVSMISTLSKIPIKQNIAVTGSINQYGEVQPIGGVNEKIEGFFKLCNMVDTAKGKAVLIPASNREDLVLNSEVEDAILKGHFKIYTMENFQDAVDVMMGNSKLSYNEVLDEAKRELKKYVTTKKK